MTNIAVFSRTYDGVRLRGLSPKTVESYWGRLKLMSSYSLIYVYNPFLTCAMFSSVISIY